VDCVILLKIMMSLYIKKNNDVTMILPISLLIQTWTENKLVVWNFELIFTFFLYISMLISCKVDGH
jgi:hypothetical protein